MKLFISLLWAIFTISGLILVAGADTPVAAQQTTSSCANSIAIPDPEDPNLVADCSTLLNIKTHWASASLNWTTTTPITAWEGVTITISRVTKLELNRKQLTGTIPAALGTLTNLTYLNLNDNQLTSTIPKELGNLSQLQTLNLHGNKLMGSIPARLGNLTNLRGLGIAHNQLTGTIPKELGNLSNLGGLGLNDNQLTGAIPKELGNLSQLRYLSLVRNQLTGAIPKELGNLSQLAYLNLKKNQLTGSIAPLTTLTNVGQLWLNYNQLTGPIPPALGTLTKLQYLTLAHNQLTGTIPTALGNLTKLQYLTLNSNQLTGTIPKELGNLINLQSLALDGNQLTGTIPKELGTLTNLRGLGLDDNQLTGTIPKELGTLSRLLRLNMAGNQLSGCIPTTLKRVSENDLSRLGLPFCLCTNTNAIPDPEPADLINECNMLLAAKDTLQGTLLNWVTTTRIYHARRGDAHDGAHGLPQVAHARAGQDGRRRQLALHPHDAHPPRHPRLCGREQPGRLPVRVRLVLAAPVHFEQRRALEDQRRVHLEHVGAEGGVVPQPRKVLLVAARRRAGQARHHVGAHLVPGVPRGPERLDHVGERVAPVGRAVRSLAQRLHAYLDARRPEPEHFVDVPLAAIVGLCLDREADAAPGGGLVGRLCLLQPARGEPVERVVARPGEPLAVRPRHEQERAADYDDLDL